MYDHSAGQMFSTGKQCGKHIQSCTTSSSRKSSFPSFHLYHEQSIFASGKPEQFIFASVWRDSIGSGAGSLFAYNSKDIARKALCKFAKPETPKSDGHGMICMFTKLYDYMARKQRHSLLVWCFKLAIRPKVRISPACKSFFHRLQNHYFEDSPKAAFRIWLSKTALQRLHQILIWCLLQRQKTNLCLHSSQLWSNATLVYWKEFTILPSLSLLYSSANKQYNRDINASKIFYWITDFSALN